MCALYLDWVLDLLSVFILPQTTAITPHSPPLTHTRACHTSGDLEDDYDPMDDLEISAADKTSMCVMQSSNLAGFSRFGDFL